MLGIYQMETKKKEVTEHLTFCGKGQENDYDLVYSDGKQGSLIPKVTTITWIGLPYMARKSQLTGGLMGWNTLKNP
jgi:hypothetical protein